MLGSFQEEYSKIQERYNTGRDKLQLDHLKEQLISKPIVLFGLGFYGLPVYKNFLSHGIRPACICDSKKYGVTVADGLPVISPKQLQQNYHDANIVISVANPQNQRSIHDQLLQLGFSNGQIFTFDTAFKFLDKSVVEITSLSYEKFQEYIKKYEWSYNFFSDEISKKIILARIQSYLFKDTFEYEESEPAYFPHDIFSFTEDEVFVDGGLYIGDTTEAFIKLVDGNYRAVYGFDIDQNNIRIARKNLSKYRDIHIVEKGLWDKSDLRHANLELLAGSQVNDKGTEVIPVIALDECFADMEKTELPTFIKMDIEGSEKKALLGSQNIIKTMRPKLAICIYHKPEDIYELPKTITNIRNDYRFTLRHYSPYTWETVLYAY